MVSLYVRLGLGFHVNTNPSARCISAANVVCRDVDVFGTKRLLLPTVYNGISFSITMIIVFKKNVYIRFPH
jgi:hypothetical protein